MDFQSSGSRWRALNKVAHRYAYIISSILLLQHLSASSSQQNNSKLQCQDLANCKTFNKKQSIQLSFVSIYRFDPSQDPLFNLFLLFSNWVGLDMRITIPLRVFTNSIINTTGINKIFIPYIFNFQR